jgi:ATP-dependent helicase HepA
MSEAIGPVVKNCLVRHEMEDGWGVVLRIEPGRITVLFDGENEPRLFTDSARLSRVEFRAGSHVVRVDNQRRGRIIGAVDGPLPRWHVIFNIDDPSVELDEGALRPDESLDPYERVLEGKLPGGIRETLVATVAHYLWHENNNNDLVSLDAARVDLKPHQVSVVHRVVSTPPHRFLLCDEVGLGKTIEAAMIIKELRAREQADRVLIIVPANLTRQWQFELKSKFNETFAILNTNTVRALQVDGTGENPFLRMNSVIVSESWISSPQWAKLVAEVHWDMVVVDEAHHARHHASGGETQLYRVVRDLTDAAQYPDRSVLFLTATPLQLNSHELYSLVEMLDPTLFPSEAAFNGYRQAMSQLNEVANIVRVTDDLSALPEAVVNNLSRWLGENVDQVKADLAGGERDEILDRLGRQHRLTEILIRNRKATISGFMPRIATQWIVELTAEEKLVIEAIEDFIEEGHRRAQTSRSNAIGFLMTSYQKMMASSLKTVGYSLRGRIERLRGAPPDEERRIEDSRALLDDLDLDEDVDLPDEAESVGSEREREITEINRILTLLDRIDLDSKAKALVEHLRLLRNEPVPKVLIFTEYLETQRQLAQLLENEGWGVNIFRGGLSSQQKDAAVEGFRTGAGPQVLISTEAGAEGRNFQFCHMLVNYDLPWNPMSVEQRIGRIDRIGQAHPVLIFNFCVKGSIEERVLNVLASRINLFEATVGGLDPILGEVATDIREIMKRAREERPDEIDRLGDRLEADVKAARAANDRLQDFIMDVRGYNREIAERILGQESPIDAAKQEWFMKTLLAVHRTYIERDDVESEWRLVFHDPFLGNHPDLFKSEIDRTRRVVFRSDERPDSDYVQYFAFGHPVVDAALRDVMTPRWSGSVGARTIKGDSQLPPSKGWLFLHIVEVPDLRPRTIFLPTFVDDFGVHVDGLGLQLVHRALSGLTELGALIDDEAINAIKRAKVVVDEIKDSVIADVSQQLVSSARERIDKEVVRLEAYYAARKEASEERIAATRRTIEEIEASGDEQRMRILPAWKKRLEGDEMRKAKFEVERQRRLMGLDALRNPVCSARLVQAVRVVVEP